MAKAHENINNEIIANTLQEIAHTQYGGHMNVLYKALTKSGDERNILRSLDTNKNMEGRMDQKDWLGNMLRLNIEQNPAFADTISYKQGMEKLAPRESILSRIKKALGRYDEGGKVGEWEETKKYKGDIKGYKDPHWMYSASGMGEGDITEREYKKKGIIPFLQRLLPGGKTGKLKSRGWSGDENINWDFINNLKKRLDIKGEKLVDIDDPSFKLGSDKTESLQDLAKLLSTNINHEAEKRYHETITGGTGKKDEYKILEDFFSSITKSQSPYSDIGFFHSMSEDMTNEESGIQEAFATLIKGIPSIGETTVKARRKK